jgi:hypothetical protein
MNALFRVINVGVPTLAVCTGSTFVQLDNNKG